MKVKTLHNHLDYAGFSVPYYNIPSNNRELQLERLNSAGSHDYNIPSNNRELQLMHQQCWLVKNYNIPSNNRELQHANAITIQLVIITYQVITGNYSSSLHNLYDSWIITYQVITGNYSAGCNSLQGFLIITYQVITGNYS